MKGAADVAAAYADLLVARVPDAVARLAVENGALVNEVSATPALVAAGERAADQIRLADWPFLLVVPQRTPSVRLDRLDDDGVRLYRIEYAVRVFAWARGDGFEETGAVRDRLTLAVLEVLLGAQQVTEWLRTSEPSIAVDYSDVVTDPGLATTIAAAAVDFMATATERLTSPDGTATITTTDLFVDTLPPVAVPHPALD